MTLKRKACFTSALLLLSLPACGQPVYGGHPQDHGRGNEHSRPARNFDNGLRQGGHGGQYGDRGREDDRHAQNRGGIGPGKGALIGGAGGAVLGAVLGQSLKGSLVGGATGAGIGAIVGGIAQNNRDSRGRH